MVISKDAGKKPLDKIQQSFTIKKKSSKKKFDNLNIEYNAKENLAGADLSYFQS